MKPNLRPKKFALAFMLGASILSPSIAMAFEDTEKAEIGEIVRQYLLDNPEIIIEMQQALEAKKTAQAAEQTSAVLAASGDAIFKNATDPVLGNPNGDVTIVEFFDYNCGFCRRAHADMQQILDSDPNVRFVLKEFPIFGPNSVAVHTVAMAFNKIAPEKYGAFHTAMMGLQGQIDEAQALSVAEAQGVDMDALRAGMKDPAIVEGFRATDNLAGGLGITGTPSYVVGNEVVVGALGKEVLIAKTDNMRKCNSTTC